ncbi:hypothetical protein ACFW0H_17955 [Pseudomonas sp. CR3202]
MWSSTLTNLLWGLARLRGTLAMFVTPAGAVPIAVSVVRAQPAREPLT